MERFEYIIKILNNSKNSLAAECLDKIRTEEIHFQPGFINVKAEIESLYELRLKTAEKLNKDKFKAEELDSWNDAIKELKTANFNQLLLSSVTTENKLYMIFVNKDTDVLGTIFFLYQYKSLEDLETYSKGLKESGYSSSTLKFKNGKLN